MARHSNDTYLNAIRHGDAAVLRGYYLDFYPSIRSYVLKNSGTEEDARDIFGDVTEALLRKLKKEDFSLTCKLNTFLTEIGARLWLKKLRRKKYRSAVTTDDPLVLKYVEEMIEPIEKTERYVLYRKKFKQLGEQCRKILQLGIREGKSHEDIAIEMGYTLLYSRKLRSQCLKKLTALIKNDPSYNELVS